MSLKYTETDLKAIAAKLAEYLQKVPDGTSTDTWHLLQAAGYDPNTFSGGELAGIHYNLFQEAEARGMTLDMSAHEFRLEGLSYNLDYVVRKAKN